MKINRYYNGELYTKKELYKNEISDEAVYKILKRVKDRINKEKEDNND